MAEQEKKVDKPQNDAGWDYTPSKTTDARFQSPAGDDDLSSIQSSSRTRNVTWTASEYIEHEHNLGWYLLLALGTVVLAALVYLLTKEYFATGTVIVIGIIVGVFAARKPQQVTYELSSRGLKIGEKEHGYGLFKSFAVMKDDDHHSVNLIPLKRLMPPISVYFEPADEQRIVEALSDYLPYEDRPADRIDRLSRKLKL